MAGFIIILLLVGDLLMSVPSSILMTLAGSVYGTVIGTVVGSVGSLLSSIIGFVVCRRFGGSITRRLISEKEIETMNKWFRRWGEGILILSRMLSMLPETMSCFAGLTRISFLRFRVLITIGTVPMAFFYSYFGSRSQTLADWSIPLILGVVVPGILWILLHLKMTQEKNQGVV